MLRVEGLQKKVLCPDHSEQLIAELPELSLPTGSSLVLTGPSGSGKTTVLHMLAGLLTPSGGSFQLDGADPFQLSLAARDHWRAQNIGFVFQSFNLLPPLTVEENLRAAVWLAQGKRWPEYEARLHSLLTEVGLADKAGLHPALLSMGEQQRVAVVRAVINEPRLILADEPTASLDERNRGVVMALLLRLTKRSHSSLIVSTHDSAVMEFFACRYDLREKRQLA